MSDSRTEKQKSCLSACHCTAGNVGKQIFIERLDSDE